MNQRFLSDEDIRRLNRDLRILIATDGTLTRMLSIVANDEIVLQIIKQKIWPIAPTAPESMQLPNGRVLQRHILLRGRSSGTAYVAAESLIAIDLLPPLIVTSLTETDRTIGEIMVASRLETFKETATVWNGASPGWAVNEGSQDSRSGTVARRYRMIAGGQPAIIITEYFLENVFSDGVQTEHYHREHSGILDATNKKSVRIK
jgi:chorismate--pyruvate lyase